MEILGGSPLTAEMDPLNLDIDQVDQLCAEGSGTDEDLCMVGAEIPFNNYCPTSYGCTTRRPDLDEESMFKIALDHKKLEEDSTEDEWIANPDSSQIIGNFYQDSRDTVPDALHFIKSGLVEKTNYLISVKAVQCKKYDSNQITCKKKGKSSQLSDPKLRLMTVAATVPGAMFAPTTTKVGGGFIRVNWIAPINRGGIKINEYSLQMGVDDNGRSGLFVEIYKGSLMYYVQGALLADKKYQFRIGTNM